MKVNKLVGIFLVVLLVLYFSEVFASQQTNPINENIFPPTILDFNATSEPQTEIKSEPDGLFARVQRFYSNSSGAMCILAFVNGATVPTTIVETFAKGEQIKIKGFDAVSIGMDASSSAASIKFDEETLVTAVVFNNPDKAIPINILNELDLAFSKGEKKLNSSSIPDDHFYLKLPQMTKEVSGNNEVRIKNPNFFNVYVGIRSNYHGKNFKVTGNSKHSIYIPNGTYEIYFVYSNQPDDLYQGDSFEIMNNGIEIQIVQVVDGNYGIKKVSK